MSHGPPQAAPVLPHRRNTPLILATDLDGTFLGGSPAQRSSLYQWIRQHRDLVTLIFVTGRDLPFIRQLTGSGEVPSPDYVIGDVGTSIAGGSLLRPMQGLESAIARQWNNAGPRIRAMLADEPGIQLQETPFRYRCSYYYDPSLLQQSTLDKIEAAGFDWLLSADIFLDVLPRGVSKGPTLTRLLRHLDLPSTYVLTAGDTLNDLSLFETGLDGVVVSNADSALRQRVAHLPNVFLSTQPGAAGILEAIARHPFHA